MYNYVVVVDHVVVDVADVAVEVVDVDDVSAANADVDYACFDVDASP